MTRLWKKILSAGLAAAFALAPAAQAITPQQVKDLLTQFYIYDIPEEAMEAETVEGIMAAIDDPYTMYLSPEMFERFMSSMSDGTLMGIGIVGTITEDGLLISSVYENTPAEKLGLTAGDLIVRVEGGPADQNPEDITTLLRGEEGTKVSFLVRHADGQEETFTTLRAKITVPATRTTLLEDGTTAYITCNTFGEETLNQFVKGTQDQTNVTLWLVDLRANDGGSVDAAAQSLGVFLGRDTMAYLRTGSDLVERYVSTQQRTTPRPAIVLVSPVTASAAELYAMAIRDHRGGLVIGSNTFGKGVAQIILSESQLPGILESGEAMRITAYQTYGYRGNTPQNIGVIPDLLVDPQYAADIAVLLTPVAPSGDRTGWAALHLGGLRWYLDLSQAKNEDTAPFFSALVSALPPACEVFLGDKDGWTQASPEELAAVSGAQNVKLRRFSDVEGDPCQQAADTLCTYGILFGMGDGTYHPSDGLTRAQLCAVLVQALNLRAADERPGFSDVPAGSWYEPYIKAAQAAGYVEGMGDNIFSPDTKVTHEQLITILGRMASKLNLSFRNASLSVPESTGVPSGYSDWARPWAWLLSASQTDTIGVPISMLYARLEDIPPQSPATRGETAMILYNILYATDIIPY